jgi:RNA polymerase sigma factor for flagellar operon FliA
VSSGPSLTEQEFVTHLPLIERVTAFVVRRHHLSPAEAEEFASQVKLHLFKDECAVLRKYQGRGSLRTYLTTVVIRLCLDFRIAAWGKYRPSAEAKRAGSVAVLFERLTVRDGHSMDEAYEILATNHGLAITRRELENLAARLPSARVGHRFESDDALTHRPSPMPSPEDEVVEEERVAAETRRTQALRAAIAELDTQDRLILALHYRDGHKVSEIAALLRLEQKPLYRRLDRLLGQLRQRLQEEGFQSPVGLEPLG